MNRIVVVLLILFLFKAEAQNTSALAIGDSLFNLGDYSRAILQFKELPESEQTNFKLAKIYEAIGNNSKAIRYYKEVVSTNPSAIQARYNYGRLLFKTANFVASDSLFKLLSEENPTKHLAQNPKTHHCSPKFILKVKTHSNYQELYPTSQSNSTK